MAHGTLEPMPQLPVSNARALAHLLADPARMQVLAAVALGASTADAILEATQLSPKDATTGLQRLQDAWLLTKGESDLAVRYDRIANMVRPPGPVPTDEQRELSPFISGRSLRSLPLKASRRTRVLEHVAASFDSERSYGEAAVNRVLERWCQGGEIDHVSLRRYLVDEGLLTREAGVYQRSA